MSDEYTETPPPLMAHTGFCLHCEGEGLELKIVEYDGGHTLACAGCRNGIEQELAGVEE